MEYVKGGIVLNIFEKSISKYKDSIAVVYEDKHVSYDMLNHKANILAHQLKDLGVRPDTLVGLGVERSLEMIIGLLAILKAGGAYVPLDPDYPRSRLEYMISDTEIKVLLTQEKLLDKWSFNGETIIIDSKDSNVKLKKETNLVENVFPNNLAYIIYTSGSTGKPKGVAVGQKGVINLAVQHSKYFNITKKDRVLQFASFNFDAAVSEWSSAFYSGATLCLLPVTKIVSDELSFNILRNQYTVIMPAPSLLPLLPDSISRFLKSIVIAGETCNTETINRFIKHSTVWNSYGPTEGTVSATLFKFKNNDKASIIGFPLPNTQIYILDKNLNRVPVGVVGEIYIGGQGLARGYWKRFGLTSENFIANPYDNGKRVYKTGDLGKYLDDGSIEFLGRADNQVKIRGYRIELGEIEHVLSNYSGIDQCVILVKEHLDTQENLMKKYIVGYYVAKEKLDEEKIFSYLKGNLQKYMIPNILVCIDNFPLTANGKLNRKALPEPQFTDECNYTAPRNDIEKGIVKIWSEILGISIDKISIKDDFFKLGGDSIMSIQLVGSLQKELKLQITIQDVFNYTTIAKLYDDVLSKKNVIDTNADKKEIQTEQGLLEGEVQLLPIQKYFFKCNFKVINHCNQSFIIKTPILEVERLLKCVRKLVERHDCLRLRYKKEDGKLKQYYSPLVEEIMLEELDVRKLSGDKEEILKKLNHIYTDWQSHFDLENGPIFKVGYVYGYIDGSARIFFAAHHLVIDTVSWRIIIKDLQSFYNGLNLGLKGSSYKQWGQVLQKYARNNVEENVYWSEHLLDSKCSKLDQLTNETIEVIYKKFQLTKLLTNSLLSEKTTEAYNTKINDLLLTTLAYVLSEITGNKAHYILMEGHGRENIDESIDINNTVGWFTTMYPVRLEIKEKIGNSIKHIKELLRQVPNKGIGFGILKGYDNNSLPKITFNYLGQLNTKGKELLDNAWRIVNENSGIQLHDSNQNYNILDINCAIMDEKLQVNIASRLGSNVTKKISKLLEEKLVQIINHCYCKIDKENTISDFKDFKVYERLNSLKKENGTIFVFPPAEGGAESYFNNIVPKLNERQLVLFNNYPLYLKNNFNIIDRFTYEELADAYISYIKSIQPKGPYTLVGWSFGGVLAFEVARKLISFNENITNLILIDAFFNFKKVLKFTNSQIQESDKRNLNFKYLPPYSEKNFARNIVLFKSLRTVNLEHISKYKEELGDIGIETMRKVYEFYVKNTKFNNLNDLIKKEYFKTINMDCDHNSWMENNSVVSKICIELLK